MRLTMNNPRSFLLISVWFFAVVFTEIVSAQSNNLPIRGLYVQFEKRGWASGYWSGDVIQSWNNFDATVGHTVAEEVALQLDSIKKFGVNTIAFELRTSDSVGTSFVFPSCLIHPVLGFRWPQPTAQEISNLKLFFDLVHSKGFKVFLRLVNTHMEEVSHENSTLWLGSILGVVKDHPALDLILFEGNTRTIDSNGDGVQDECGIPAEPPLWLGASSVPGKYVQWAISYAKSLGLPYRKLSAEAVVGDFFTMSQPPSGPDATDNHLWSPIAVLKTIFDSLTIPNDQRTYAISLYEHKKCQNAQSLPCTDKNPHEWARETFDHIFATIGKGNGARVVAPEMGLSSAADTSWKTGQAVESLISLMKEYGVDGGCFWRWVNFENGEDANPSVPDAVKRRGVNFVYNPVKNILASGYVTIVERDNRTMPMLFALGQNFPNPFNPRTTIQFSLPADAFVSLKIFNSLGELVTLLLSQKLSSGNYSTEWNAFGFASGIYYYQLQIVSSRYNSIVETKKLVLLK